MAYKIKTTAPRLYVVRPNSSILEPGTSVEVAIIRQAKEHSKTEDRRKDKFLVLSTVVENVPESVNYASLWSDLEADKSREIASKKIRVQTSPTSKPSPLSNEITPAAPKVALSAVPQPNSRELAEDASTTSGAASVPIPDGAPVDSYAATSAVAPAPQPADTTRLETPIKTLNGGTHSTGISKGLTDETTQHRKDEVQQASDKAREQISSLSKELRSEQVSSPLPTPAPARQKAAYDVQNGVPVHFVFLLVTIAFLIGWKLF